VEYAGDFMLTGTETETAPTPSVAVIPTVPVYYPLVNTAWYPRHGYLHRSTFQLTFHSKPRDNVAGPGIRSESSSEGEKTTRYSQDTPISFATFAGGDFRLAERRDEKGVTFQYYSVRGDDPEFRLNELQNSLTYFSQLFGPYPYQVLRGVYHPRPFGQGFPTLLLLAPGIEGAMGMEKFEHSFVAHETAHQWWGGMVGWRSYRDQWLSEAFAEYSGEIYTAARMNPQAGRDLIRRMRRGLQEPPVGEIGVHQGKVAQLGPIILGSRLATRETLNAYQVLIYAKGALILRMLQFLISDPQTGDDKAFFEMLKEFVERNNGRAASTDDFRNLASAYFERSPIGRQYNLKDLNWFFRQWVYEAYLPSYRMEYRLDDQPDGGVLMRGTMHQENAGDKWFMPLPVIVHFGKNKFARSVLYAYGEHKDFALKLPARPSAVQLDPDLWILSDATTTSSVH
jgi:aminopeptidase N